MPFLYTKSSNITFLTENIYISKILDKIVKEFNTVTNMYKARSFNEDISHRYNILLHGIHRHNKHIE